MLVIINKEVLDRLGAFGREHSCKTSLGISDVDRPVLYLSDFEDTLLLVEDANFYVTNPSRTETWHVLLFYRAA